MPVQSTHAAPGHHWLSELAAPAIELTAHSQVTFRAPPRLSALAQLQGVTMEESGPRTIVLEFDGRVHSALSLLEQCRTMGELADFSMQEPRLEDVMRGFYRKD